MMMNPRIADPVSVLLAVVPCDEETFPPPDPPTGGMMIIGGTL
jgi:hypothetical protein